MTDTPTPTEAPVTGPSVSSAQSDYDAAVTAHEAAVNALEAAKGLCVNCGGEDDVPVAFDPDVHDEIEDRHRFGAVHLPHAAEQEAAYAELAITSRKRNRAEKVLGATKVLAAQS